MKTVLRQGKELSARAKWQKVEGMLSSYEPEKGKRSDQRKVKKTKRASKKRITGMGTEELVPISVN